MSEETTTEDIVTKTKEYTDEVRTAIYGKEVRSAIADSIDGIAQNVKDEIARDTVLNDLKTGVDGTVYDSAGDAVRGQITGLEEKITNHIKEYENIIDFDDFEIGKYYSNVYVNKTENAEYCILPLIALKKNTTYTISDVEKEFTFVARDEMNNIKLTTYLTQIEYVENDDGSLTFTTNDVTNGIYITISRWSYASARFCLGSSVPNIYFEDKYIETVNPLEKVEHNIYVSSDVTRDTQGYGTIFFNKITKAVASIKDNNKYNIYNIYIKSGTYNIFTELGGSTYTLGISTTNGERQGLVLPDYVNLIGKGQVIIDGRISDADSTVASSTCLSPINMWKHNKIKNIIILAQNTRYCIHCESNNAFTDTDIEIDNCTCIHFGRTRDELWGSSQAFGGGSGSGAKFTIKNSRFKSAMTQGFSLHTNSNQKSNTLDIDGCYFEGAGTNPGIVLFSYGSSSENGNCYFKNSKSIPKTLTDWTSDDEEKTWNIFNYVDDVFQILEI